MSVLVPEENTPKLLDERYEIAKAKALKEFVEPKYPYILMLARKIISRNAHSLIDFVPFMMNVSGTTIGGTGNNFHRFQQYRNKGWGVLKYRMPSEDEKIKLKDATQGYSDYGDIDHWDELEQKIKESLGLDIKQLDEERELKQKAMSERDALQDRVEQLEKERAATAAKQTAASSQSSSARRSS